MLSAINPTLIVLMHKIELVYIVVYRFPRAGVIWTSGARQVPSRALIVRSLWFEVW